MNLPWSEERQRLAPGVFEFIPGSTFDFKVDIGPTEFLPEEELKDVPHGLAQDLLAELARVEGLRANASYQPYGGKWPWPDDEPVYLPVPAPMPDWVVYIGFGLQVASVPAMLPVYISALKTVVGWFARKREQDQRVRKLNLTLTSKKGMTIDLGSLHAGDVEKLQLMVEEELKDYPTVSSNAPG